MGDSILKRAAQNTADVKRIGRYRDRNGPERWAKLFNPPIGAVDQELNIKVFKQSEYPLHEIPELQNNIVVIFEDFSSMIIPFADNKQIYDAVGMGKDHIKYWYIAPKYVRPKHSDDSEYYRNYAKHKQGFETKFVNPDGTPKLPL